MGQVVVKGGAEMEIAYKIIIAALAVTVYFAYDFGKFIGYKGSK
jgi:hypothetical protein